MQVTSGSRYGIDGIAEVFSHLISMVVPGNSASQNPELPVYALSLLNTAISAGSSGELEALQ